MTFNRRPPRVEAILSRICQELGIQRGDILGPARTTTIMRGRKQACQNLRELGLSYPEIARYLNYQDHTSVRHHCRFLPVEISPPNTMLFKATGTYAAPMPPDLTASLAESIQQHMKAYGLENIEVRGKPASTITQEPPK